jgi:hypothetical protein
MQLASSVLREPGQRLVTIPVVIGVRQAVEGVSDRRHELISGRLEAFTPTGRSIATAHLGAKVTVVKGAVGDVGYEVVARIRLPPGKYQLRAGARAESDGKTGSVYADIDVEPLPRNGFALSPLMVSTQPALASAPRDTLRDIVPLVPTSLREFARSMRVIAFAQLAFGEAPQLEPVRMRSVILDAGNQTVHSSDATITPPPFEQDRIVFHHVPVPTEALPSGIYLLTIRAERKGMKVPIERHLRFRIQ